MTQSDDVTVLPSLSSQRPWASVEPVWPAAQQEDPDDTNTGWCEKSEKISHHTKCTNQNIYTTHFLLCTTVCVCACLCAVIWLVLQQIVQGHMGSPQLSAQPLGLEVDMEGGRDKQQRRLNCKRIYGGLLYCVLIFEVNVHEPTKKLEVCSNSHTFLSSQKYNLSRGCFDWNVSELTKCSSTTHHGVFPNRRGAEQHHPGNWHTHTHRLTQHVDPVWGPNGKINSVEVEGVTAPSSGGSRFNKPPLF